MANFLKKQGVGFYFNALALILGLAGLIVMGISNSTASAYAYNSYTVYNTLLVAGIALIALAIASPNRLGNHDIASTVGVLGAIAAFTWVVGSVINERILLISGLFSYNSGNMIGWQVFYITVGALVCLLAAVLLLIIGAFCKSVKA